MSREVYKKLAQKLDNLPNRFPATKSGVEINLLEKIFSLPEATLASEMYLTKEPASVIAARANISEKEARRTLKDMVRKRVILHFPREKLKDPIIHNLGQQFNITIKIHLAEVTEDIGWLKIEFEGEPQQMEDGIAWVMSRGIRVEVVAEEEGQ